MGQHPKQAREYSKLKIQLAVIQLILTAAFLIIMFFSGASQLLKEFVTKYSQSFYLQLALYLTILGSTYYLLFLGLEFYGNFLLEHKYLLSSQSVCSWLKKSLKKELLSLLLFIAAGEVIYFFLRLFPDYWWLPVTVAWVSLTIVLGKIAPILIIPLFYKCSPLPNAELKEKLLRLSKNCGVEIKNVFEIQLSKDTHKANAAITGLGKGQRILLSDTLLKNYQEEEIEAIFAHELGHMCLLHTRKLFLFGAAISTAGFYLTFSFCRAGLSFFGINEIYDIASFPLFALILMLVGLIFTPIQNGYLRHLEKQADIFAIEHIENSQSFASAMRKLAKQNLINPSPGRFAELLFHDHPPISKRLRYTGEKNERNPSHEKPAKGVD